VSAAADVDGVRSNGAPAAGALGRPRLHFRRTSSTNDRARELAGAGAPHGTLVTAAEQSAGRGRQGRSWSAPANSALLMSLLLRSPPALLPLAAAIAVCDVVGGDALIKWPNDVVLAGERGLAKLAGVLIEGRPQERWAVLGVGLNVAVDLAELSPDVRANAASLGRPPADIEQLLQQLLVTLEQRLHASQESTLSSWRERDALRGRDVAWASGRGRAEGVDGEGRLVVALAGGGHTALRAGEVHLLEVA
jgi:BirA family biotin operon repressor/biotin-[acetyl-CoA-carboxylase] ligase